MHYMYTNTYTHTLDVCHHFGIEIAIIPMYAYMYAYISLHLYIGRSELASIWHHFGIEIAIYMHTCTHTFHYMYT
jgi:hypothetical protein